MSGGGVQNVPGLNLYLHINRFCSRAQTDTASQSSSISAEPKIAPTRSDARHTPAHHWLLIHIQLEDTHTHWNNHQKTNKHITTPSFEIHGMDQQITHSGRCSASWFYHSSEAGRAGKEHEMAWFYSPDRGKRRRRAQERVIETLENVRHPSVSHGTWAVGAQLAALPGHLRPAHVTLFMNGAVWRREDAAPTRRSRSRRARMRRRWNRLRWLRGGAKGDKEEGGFQRRCSQEKQVRL